MDIETRMEWIKKGPTEELLTENRIKEFLSTGEKMKHYIGFEVSGLVHLGTGLVSGKKIAQLQKAGIETEVFIADWHAWINNKLGGDFKSINEAAGYFKDALWISIKVMGGNPSKTKFVLGSDLYHNNDDYWKTVMDISKNLTVSRVKRAITIAGRAEGESVNFAQLIYPAMQVADIFAQSIHLPHGGMDQRKAHVIAIDVADKIKFNQLKIKGEVVKPAAIHQSLIMGLQKPPIYPVPEDKIKDVIKSMKMSKSKPKTAVFIHDEPEQIKAKLKSAFCPAKDVSYNPVLNWVEHLAEFPFKVERSEKFGGTVEYEKFDDLKSDFRAGKLHPADLKNAAANYLIKLLEPVRKHFSSGEAKRNKDIMEAAVRKAYS